MESVRAEELAGYEISLAVKPKHYMDNEWDTDQVRRFVNFDTTA